MLLLCSWSSYASDTQWPWNGIPNPFYVRLYAFQGKLKKKNEEREKSAVVHNAIYTMPHHMILWNLLNDRAMY